jgi:broad specificity phosphatase PhoE
MTRVVLIRAGATVYDEQGRVQGVLDLPLSDRGRAEVVALAGELAGAELAAVYYGPGESLQRTAEAISRAAGLRPKRIDDLRNLDCGLWQGLQAEEIRRRNPKVFRQWLDDPLTVCPPDGETVEEALDRLREAIRPLLKRHRDEAFALVLAEPLTQFVAGFLRRSPRIQLENELPTGRCEWIAVAAELFGNGETA